MANIQAAAIITRIREVVEDGRGSARTISAGTFSGDLPEGLSVDAEHMRAVTGARCEAKITRQTISDSSPSTIGNLFIYEIDVEVRVIRLILPVEQIDDDTRDALQALAVKDADLLNQALNYPGNLTQTQAAVVTDLASGLLRYSGSSHARVGAVNDGSQTLETTHTFTGWAFARPAV